MKQSIKLFALLLLLASTSAAAHEKGDLILNIEPQLGFSYPNLMLFINRGFMPGFDFGLGGTVNYYVASFFYVNVGLGYNAHFGVFYDDSKGVGFNSSVNPVFYFVPALGQLVLIFDYLRSLAESAIYDSNNFFASYLTIPFGLGLDFRKVALSAGLTANIPLHLESGTYYVKRYERDTSPTPITFTLKPYLGWYGDIGVPMKKRFSAAFRVSGSFAKDTVATSNDDLFKPEIEPDTFWGFNFVTLSVIFKVGGFRLANFSNK